MMKKIFLSLSIFLATTVFADSFTLDNRSTYPSNQSKLEIQWAFSAKEVEEGSQALTRGRQPNGANLQAITQSGKINLTIPKAAEYFRVLAWSKGDGKPDLLTNWVEVVPGKTYTLETDHLFPAVLMCGSGC